MQSRGLEIVVGFFVCLGIAAIFILTMRVSNLADVSVDQGYQVTAQFSNIGGLKIGSRVNLAGVRIGRVSNIEIDQQTYEAKVTLNVENKYKIPEDSDASILTAGLLGEQYIGIGPGASDTYLKQGDKITLTQSAVILEQVIGQVLYSLTSDKKEGTSDSGGDSGGGFGGDNSLPPPQPAAGPSAGTDKPQASDDAGKPGDDSAKVKQ